jgi:hypothetical protein
VGVWKMSAVVRTVHTARCQVGVWKMSAVVRTIHTARCQVGVWKMSAVVRTQTFPALLLLRDKESYSGCSCLNILV